MTSKYLKEKLYYENRYDKLTIEECRRHEKSFSSISLPKYRGKKIPKKTEDGLRKVFIDLVLYNIKGERYNCKEETIKEWMDQDKIMDKKIEDAVTPRNIKCSCGLPMEFSLKMFGIGAHTDEVMFLFKCPRCKNGRAVYESGEERVSTDEKCVICGEKNHVKRTGNGEIVTTYKKCTACNHEVVESLDLSIKKEDVDDNLEKDKERFCISDEEGREYMDFLRNMKISEEYREKEKEKEQHKEIYDQLNRLRKITIVELESLLLKSLEKHEYIKLELSSPEIGKDVIISFTMRDAKNERTEYDSKNNLRKLIDKILFDTNWRLMSDGVDYRMGILSGRIRGIDNEDQLMSLIKVGKKGVSILN